MISQKVKILVVLLEDTFQRHGLDTQVDYIDDDKQSLTVRVHFLHGDTFGQTMTSDFTFYYGKDVVDYSIKSWDVERSLSMENSKRFYDSLWEFVEGEIKND